MTQRTPDLSQRSPRGRAIAALTGAVCAVLLGGCNSIFQGFSILPPEEAQRLPIVIDVNAERLMPAAGDPAVIPLIEGLPRSSVSLIQIRQEVAPHLHEHSDETIYILEGGGKLLLNREWRDVREGMLIHIPRSVPHAFRNEAADGTWVLSTFTPPHVVGDRVALDYDP